MGANVNMASNDKGAKVLLCDDKRLLLLLTASYCADVPQHYVLVLPDYMWQVCLMMRFVDVVKNTSKFSLQQPFTNSQLYRAHTCKVKS